VESRVVERYVLGLYPVVALHPLTRGPWVLRRDDLDRPPGLNRLNPVDLRGQDEIALGKAVDLVGPDRDAGLSPGEIDVGMMPLFFSDGAHLIHKLEGGLEVRKLKLPFNMMVFDDLPLFYLSLQRPDLVRR